MVSDAYNQGRRAKSYGDNPYDKNSSQYNEFERGYTQKLKRTPNAFFRGESGEIGAEPEREVLKGSRIVKAKLEVRANSYSEARKK